MKLRKNKNLISLALIFISLFFWIYPVQKEALWEKDKVIVWDIISYYAYLPATFIYDDISLKFKEHLPSDVKKKVWAKKTNHKNNYVLKMTMGNAIMYSPFFFIAHQHAKLVGIDANGYSEPYSRWLVYSSIFYALMAMIIMRKTLLKFFNDITVAITLIVIFFGTNLYNYTVYEGTMSHIFSFFLISLFIYESILWHEKPNNWKALIIGLIGGLITLIRPTNIIVFFFPLLYNVYNLQTLKQKIQLLRNNWVQIVIIIASSILVCTPQLFYWKYTTGHWLYQSYGDEGFFFFNPQITNGLFSFRKGWLLYTPLMIFSIIGIPLLFRKLKAFAFPITLFLILNIWIIYSWWTWWYGASFGSRPMIDSYPILAFPLALVLSYFVQKKWRFVLGLLIIIFFIRLNIFQTKQYKKALLHFDSMTKEAYFGIWNKSHFPDGYNKLIKRPDYDAAIKGQKEY